MAKKAKKSKTKKKKIEEVPQLELKNEVRKDIFALLMVLGAIFLLATQLYPSMTGILGEFLMLNILTPLIGKGVYAFPLVLGLSGILLLLRRNYLRAQWRLFGVALGFSVFVLMSEIYATGAIYRFELPQDLSLGGGVLGYYGSFYLQKTIGAAGTYFCLLFMSLISVLLVLNLSLRNIRDIFKSIFSQFLHQELLPTMRSEARQTKKTQAIYPSAQYEPANHLEQQILAHLKGEEGSAPQTVTRLRKAQAKVVDEPSNPVVPLRQNTKNSQSSSLMGPTGFVSFEVDENYELPNLNLLKKPKKNLALKNRLQQQTEQDIQILESTLANFKIDARVVNLSHGPSITRYELQPGPGVRVNRIAALSDDISLSLAASGVRIEAPIPGKSVVGVEVPNTETVPVSMYELAEDQNFMEHPSKLFCVLGRNISGEPIYYDIASMPHMLIAGATGSGKSVCLNTLICSILMRATPQEVKFLMIDPKRVELTPYNHIPHLLTPVVNDPRLASVALKKWAVSEMERRYDFCSKVGVRNLESFNQKVTELKQKGYDTWQDANYLTDVEEPLPLKHEPYIVVIIDELADLMMIASGDVENAICRIAQMARAVGIHLVIATQRPSVDVITGLIKANIPSRIAFAVSSQIDSRTILDTMGAEKLLGKGDMLYSPVGLRKSMRVQGVYLSDDEIQKIVRFTRSQAKPHYQIDMEQLAIEEEQSGSGKTAEAGRDPYFQQATEIVSTTGRHSISYLQRKLRIGYNRAARLHEELQEAGIIPSGQAAA